MFLCSSVGPTLGVGEIPSNGPQQVLPRPIETVLLTDLIGGDGAVVSQTLGLLQVVGDLVLLEHHPLQGVLHADQADLTAGARLSGYFLLISFR